MAVVFRLLLFQKSYIEREVWRERVVIFARTLSWRMTGSASSALDVDYWPKYLIRGEGSGKKGRFQRV